MKVYMDAAWENAFQFDAVITGTVTTGGFWADCDWWQFQFHPVRNGDTGFVIIPLEVDAEISIPPRQMRGFSAV